MLEPCFKVSALLVFQGRKGWRFSTKIPGFLKISAVRLELKKNCKIFAVAKPEKEPSRVCARRSAIINFSQ
jgi:hypothetical protein